MPISLRFCGTRLLTRLLEEVERRTASHAELTQSLQAAADREAADRSLSHATLSRAVNALESELLPIKKVVLGPSTPPAERKGEIDRALKGFQASITNALAEQAEATRLESKRFCEDLHRPLPGLLRQEAIAREALADQLTAQRIITEELRQSLDARIAGERVFQLGLLERSLDEARQLALRSSAEQRRVMLRAATKGDTLGHS